MTCNQIGDQPLIARSVLSENDSCFANTNVYIQSRVDLAQLDTVAAQLHLMIDAAQILAKVDAKELAAVDKAAREANEIIDQRTFSWTDVFSHFERTLPPDVRITSVQQQAARQVVVIDAEAQSVDDVDRFIEALEKTGAFRDVVPRNEVLMEDDTIEAKLEATYVPQLRPTEKRP